VGVNFRVGGWLFPWTSLNYRDKGSGAVEGTVTGS